MKKQETNEGLWCSNTALILSLLSLIPQPLFFVVLISSFIFGVISIKKQYAGQIRTKIALIILSFSTFSYTFYLWVLTGMSSNPNYQMVLSFFSTLGSVILFFLILGAAIYFIISLLEKKK